MAPVPAVVLPVDPSSVAAARRLVREALSGQQSESADDAVLLISELVTNAVRHTRHLVHVQVDVQDSLLRVEVTDDHPDLPRVSVPEDHATSRRGLHIVDLLADRWGVTRAADGKTVWFEIRLAGRGRVSGR